MTTSDNRDGHLTWCKNRALEILDDGDLEGAVTSMLSDVNKWREPLYNPAVLTTLQMQGIMFCKTRDQVKHWIEGFA